MNKKQKKILKILIDKGSQLLRSPAVNCGQFTSNEKANKLLNDLDEHPHAFVLARVMDRQIKAEKAWLIPHKISNEIGGFEFLKLLNFRKSDYKKLFNGKKLHRFNNVMADNFYLAVRKIHEKYDDIASNIWADEPSSGTIVNRFLEFKGVGKKISSMAVNILARRFKIPMKDYTSIDISPDVHVKRVFERIGFISPKANNDELISCARELNADYPGIFDLSVWIIGRKWCRPNNPDCKNCYLNKYCPKIL